MDGCGCVLTPSNQGNATVTSAVTYDGSSLPCITFSSGNMNDLAMAVALAICALQESVSTITVNTNQTVTIGLNDNCLYITNGMTLTQVLNIMMANICNLLTEISAITTDEVTGVNITTPNCIGITNGMSLTTIINDIVSYICHHNNGVFPKNPISFGAVDPLSSVKVGDSYDNATYRNPLLSYVQTPVTYTDTSAGGQAQITFPALNFYVDSRIVDMPSEAVNLTNSADNYIYLDNTNGWVYNISAVAIGNPAPTVTGAIVGIVTTGVGSITTVTQIIANYPINNSLLDSLCVKARNLNANTVSDGGGILQDSNGAYKINPDNTTIQVTGNALVIKKVYKANIDSGVAGSGMIQNVDGSLSPNIGGSIVNVSGVNKLLNDTPVPNSLYGQDTNGNQGFLVQPLIYKARLQQIGTSAPTPIVIYNTLGNIVWSYNSIGSYFATLAGAFTTVSKVLITGVNNKKDSVAGDFTFACIYNADTCSVASYNTAGQVDGLLVDYSLTIEVYP